MLRHCAPPPLGMEDIPIDVLHGIAIQLPIRALARLALCSAWSGGVARRAALECSFWTATRGYEDTYGLRQLVKALTIRMVPEEALPFAQALWQTIGSHEWKQVQSKAARITHTIAEAVCAQWRLWTTEQLAQLLLPEIGSDASIDATDQAAGVDLAPNAEWQELLLAVRDGSIRAADRLPEALELLRTCPEHWAEASALLCSCVSSRQHAFLRWADHLVALLRQPHGCACIAAALLELARIGSPPLYFAFFAQWPLLTGDEYALTDIPPTCAAAVQQLAEMLHDDALATFAAGMRYLLRADLHIMRYLNAIARHLHDGDVTEAAAVYRKMQRLILRPFPWHGGADARGVALRTLSATLLPTLNVLCGEAGEALHACSWRQFRREVGKMQALLRVHPMLRTHQRGSPLHVISPILAAYDAAGEGTAVQLTGHGPSETIYIERFGGTVAFLHGLTGPARIEIVCREGLAAPLVTRRFLVKDVSELEGRLALSRQRKGLEERPSCLLQGGVLLGVFARILANQPDCVVQGLRLRTDGVRALCIGECALIEWCSTSADYSFARIIARQVQQLPFGAGRAIDAYQQESMKSSWFLNLTAEEVTKKFCDLQSQLPECMLKQGLAANCTSLAEYDQVRARFVRSLAAFTAVSYALGLGNRHLDQFLVDPLCGEIIGIDLDMLNGYAATLPCPEIVGVRLTGQMIGVAGPTRVAHAALTVHLRTALGALRSALPALQRSLAAHDPALAAGVATRLSGEHPSHGTRSDLQSRVGRNRSRPLTPQLLEELAESVLGAAISRRRELPATGLSVAEQVECILEQATDPAILGRTYPGWCPWL